MTDIRLKVGGSAHVDGVAFVEAWHRIERGDTSADHILSFQSWETLAAILTTERLRLLRHVHGKPEPSIMALAKALGRQYRRVHDDVTVLADNGLVQRDEGGISTLVDRIEAVIELA